MDNYDDYISGLYDSNSPINSKELELEHENFGLIEQLVRESETTISEPLMEVVDSINSWSYELKETHKRIRCIERDLCIWGEITTKERIELQTLKNKLHELIGKI